MHHSALSERSYHLREIKGAVLDPIAAFPLLRGMRALQLRVE